MDTKKIIALIFIMFLYSCASKIPAPVETQTYENKQPSEDKENKASCPDYTNLKKVKHCLVLVLSVGLTIKM